eukprot:15460941-Alexandrium_andersonii.AAC.1
MRVSVKGPLIAAPGAHALQDLRGRAGPLRGLADEAAPDAGRRQLGNAHPESAHTLNPALHAWLV